MERLFGIQRCQGSQLQAPSSLTKDRDGASESRAQIDRAVRGLVLLLISFGSCVKIGFAQFPLANPQDDQTFWMQSYLYNGSNEDQFRQRLQSQYEIKIDLLKIVCRLDETQIRKLNLAASNDLRRFLRESEQVNREIAGLTRDRQEDSEKALTAIQPLQQRVRVGLFESGSLFDTVMTTSLTKEQWNAYETFVARRRGEKAKTLVRLMVLDLEDRVPLVEQQRQQLLQLLDDQLLPNFRNQLDRNTFDSLIGYIKLVKLKRNELEKFLDKNQLVVIDKVREQYRAYGLMIGDE